MWRNGNGRDLEAEHREEAVRARLSSKGGESPLGDAVRGVRVALKAAPAASAGA